MTVETPLAAAIRHAEFRLSGRPLVSEDELVLALERLLPHAKAAEVALRSVAMLRDFPEDGDATRAGLLETALRIVREAAAGARSERGPAAIHALGPLA